MDYPNLEYALHEYGALEYGFEYEPFPNSTLFSAEGLGDSTVKAQGVNNAIGEAKGTSTTSIAGNYLFLSETEIATSTLLEVLTAYDVNTSYSGNGSSLAKFALGGSVFTITGFTKVTPNIVAFHNTRTRIKGETEVDIGISALKSTKFVSTYSTGSFNTVAQALVNRRVRFKGDSNAGFEPADVIFTEFDFLGTSEAEFYVFEGTIFLLRSGGESKFTGAALRHATLTSTSSTRLGLLGQRVSNAIYEEDHTSDVQLLAQGVASGRLYSRGRTYPLLRSQALKSAFFDELSGSHTDLIGNCFFNSETQIIGLSGVLVDSFLVRIKDGVYQIVGTSAQNYFTNAKAYKGTDFLTQGETLFDPHGFRVAHLEGAYTGSGGTNSELTVAHVYLGEMDVAGTSLSVWQRGNQLFTYLPPAYAKTIRPHEERTTRWKQ